MSKIKTVNTLLPTRERVKKHVAAIHTSGEFSLLERKMSNVLLLNAYDVLLTQRTHSLPIKHLCAMLGWDESNNIERLQDTLRKLVSTSIEFNMMEDGKKSWRIMSMLSFGAIEEGLCTYRYDEYLAERLYDPEIYATINIGVQRRFDSSYALTLYENCVRYKTVGSTGWWDLVKFRHIMGANAVLYDEFYRLNERVIKPSIKEINSVSDIQLAAEFQKQGRRISGVRFLITENPQKSLLNIEIQDAHADVRESDLFKRLLDHGIGERLAILWILQDELRAKEVVEYVEAKARKKQVKGSTAGYIRTLYESEAVVGKTLFEEKNEQEEQDKVEEKQRKLVEKRRVELESKFVREQTNEAIKTLSIDNKRAWARAYIDEVGSEKIKTYSIEVADFRDSLERIQFIGWLRKHIAPVIDPAALKAWLNSNGLD